MNPASGLPEPSTRPRRPADTLVSTHARTGPSYTTPAARQSSVRHGLSAQYRPLHHASYELPPPPGLRPSHDFYEVPPPPGLRPPRGRPSFGRARSNLSTQNLTPPGMPSMSREHFGDIPVLGGRGLAGRSASTVTPTLHGRGLAGGLTSNFTPTLRGRGLAGGLASTIRPAPRGYSGYEFSRLAYPYMIDTLQNEQKGRGRTHK